MNWAAPTSGSLTFLAPSPWTPPLAGLIPSTGGLYSLQSHLPLASPCELLLLAGFLSIALLLSNILCIFLFGLSSTPTTPSPQECKLQRTGLCCLFTAVSAGARTAPGTEQGVPVYHINVWMDGGPLGRNAALVTSCGPGCLASVRLAHRRCSGKGSDPLRMGKERRGEKCSRCARREGRAPPIAHRQPLPPLPRPPPVALHPEGRPAEPLDAHGPAAPRPGPRGASGGGSPGAARQPRLVTCELRAAVPPGRPLPFCLRPAPFLGQPPCGGPFAAGQTRPTVGSAGPGARGMVSSLPSSPSSDQCPLVILHLIPSPMITFDPPSGLRLRHSREPHPI